MIQHFVVWEIDSSKTPRTMYLPNQPEDDSVYKPKHVARNTTNTSNKLRVVYDYIIL